MNYHGKRITVMGLGSFGGGVGAVKFLAQRGADVTVTDLRSEDELADSLRELDDCRLTALHLGGHLEDDFCAADMIVVSPAIDCGNRFLQFALRSNIPLTSEMTLFWQHNRGRIVGVTGSNGKSTTAALTHALLKAGGYRCWLGGNIGCSLLPLVDSIRSEDWVVLELSSFQLDDLASIRISPDVAVVTNFSPNHLDRHGSLEAYRRAKQNILAWQTPQQTAILNRDDTDVATWPTRGKRMWFGNFSEIGTAGLFQLDEAVLFRDGNREEILPLEQWLTLPGAHNFQNAMAATCCALCLGVPATAIETGLRSFEPLPHRLQLVAEIGGRRFFNDSVATTPAAAAAALASFASPIVLIAGGYDKSIDLGGLARLIAERVKAVALIGQTADRLCQLIQNHAPDGMTNRPSVRCYGNLPQAFDWAVQQSHGGDIVLLSPGCASYDNFRDFRQRGEAFMQLVEHAQKIGQLKPTSRQVPM